MSDATDRALQRWPAPWRADHGKKTHVYDANGFEIDLLMHERFEATSDLNELIAVAVSAYAAQRVQPTDIEVRSALTWVEAIVGIIERCTERSDVYYEFEWSDRQKAQQALATVRALAADFVRKTSDEQQQPEQ